MSGTTPTGARTYVLGDIVRRNIVTIPQDATIDAAVRVLDERLLSALGVSGPGGELVGLLSLRDLVGRAKSDSVRSAMTPLAFTVSAGTAVHTAARLMCDSRLHRLFVEEGGRIIGLVTLTDIARLVGAVGLGNEAPTDDLPLSEVVHVDKPREAFIASLDRCGDGLVTVFYRRFMASSPGVRARFTTTDMKAQERKVAHTLRLAVGAVEGEQEALAELSRQAERHSRTGLDVVPELYQAWLEALIAAVAECDPHFDLVVEHSWRLLMGNVVRRMVRAY